MMLGRELNRRELFVVAAGLLTALVLLILFGAVLPWREHLNRLDRRIEARQAELRQFRQKLATWKQLRRSAARLNSASTRGTPLIGLVENMATQLGARDKLVSLRPQPLSGGKGERVEVRFERLRLDQLGQLLYRSDTARPPLRTESLTIRPRFEDPAQLDVVLLLSREAGP